MKKKEGSGYIDCHSHILSGVDDGSTSMAMSMEMLDIAYKEGIRGMIATPHYHPGRSLKGYDELLEKFHELKETAKSIHPDMKLYLGREAYYTSDLLDVIENGENMTIEGTNYILIEYSSRVDFTYIRKSIHNTVQAGLIPIIAHIERYACMVDDIHLVQELRDMGAVIQVNSDSIVGLVGRKIKRYTKKLLKYHYIDIVATDAHSTGSRAPRIIECVSYVSKRYGQDYMEELLIKNPQKIIEGKYLEEIN